MNLSSIFPVYDHWGYDLRQKQLLLGQTKGWMFPSFSSPFFLPRYSEHKTPTGNLAHFGHFSSKWVIAWGGFFFLSFCPGFFPTHPRHDVIESNHRTQCIGFFWRHWCIIALPLFISCQQSFLSQFFDSVRSVSSLHVIPFLPTRPSPSFLCSLCSYCIFSYCDLRSYFLIYIFLQFLLEVKWTSAVYSQFMITEVTISDRNNFS